MIDVLRFWLIVQLFALAALPLAWRLLGALPSRGYVLAKPLGLLLVTYLLWMGGSLGLLRNSVGGILLCWLLVLILSLWVGRDGWRRSVSASTQEAGRPLFAWLRMHWRLVVATEVLFLVALGFWAFVRSYSPEITTAGGEKFMELTFLNGILRSDRFPPLDPWLSGYAISYYYFGYIMLAALTQLSGLAPSVAFNVGLATWFALTLTTAFGVTFDMVAALVRSPSVRGPLEQARQRADSGAALAGGLLGALFVAVVSNLEGFLEFDARPRVGIPGLLALVGYQGSQLPGRPSLYGAGRQLPASCPGSCRSASSGGGAPAGSSPTGTCWGML